MARRDFKLKRPDLLLFLRGIWTHTLGVFLRGNPHAINARRRKIAKNMNGLVGHFPTMFCMAHLRHTQLDTRPEVCLTRYSKKTTKRLKTILNQLNPKKKWGYMTSLKNDMFKLSGQIDSVLKISGTTLDSKRRIVANFNPLFYVFGYELKIKPWLSYEEMYGH
ncbi:hypothetical protein UFOVP202_46 [uncultured Caudovirales phage]|uniref:Uncharacterized protein n=1 Tax=uncultured Caudovirales phage TaxID=2100421 RepID=A0A6J7WPP1_9CAUD|nr:hypothetical protein UFOVP202_46 [uncultured Caudovirales phage]